MYYDLRRAKRLVPIDRMFIRYIGKAGPGVNLIALVGGSAVNWLYTEGSHARTVHLGH